MSEFNKIKSNLDLSPKHIKNTVNVTILSTFSLSIITFIVYYIYHSISKVSHNNILKFLIPAVIIGGLITGGVYFFIYKEDTEDRFTELNKNTLNVTILSIFSLSIIGFIVYYIYNSIGKVPNNNILKLLIPAVIFGGLLIGGVYYSISYKTDDEYDFVSSDRMENINSVFTSYFGNRWPMIFACFGILLCIIIIQLYFNVSSYNLTINDDNNFHKLQIFLLWFGIIFTLLVAGIFLLGYKKYRSDKIKKSETEGDFSSYNSKKSNVVQFIGILLATIVILIILLKTLITFLHKNR